jgi:ABC-2 type transport system permease protein
VPEITRVPVSQLVASLAILGGLSITVTFFRIYVLMYGKRPRLREIVRALRAS